MSKLYFDIFINWLYSILKLRCLKIYCVDLAENIILGFGWKYNSGIWLKIYCVLWSDVLHCWCINIFLHDIRESTICLVLRQTCIHYRRYILMQQEHAWLCDGLKLRKLLYMYSPRFLSSMRWIYLVFCSRVKLRDIRRRIIIDFVDHQWTLVNSRSLHLRYNRCVTSTKHQAPSTKHQAPSTKHQAPSTKYQVPSAKHQAPSTKH
jgi:hypothetical protein